MQPQQVPQRACVSWAVSPTSLDREPEHKAPVASVQSPGPPPRLGSALESCCLVSLPIPSLAPWHQHQIHLAGAAVISVHTTHTSTHSEFSTVLLAWYLPAFSSY